MPEYCPLDVCNWQNKFTMKCNWPTDNCPYKEKRDLAQMRLDTAKEAQAKARLRRMQDHMSSIKGLIKRKSGKWSVHISSGGTIGDQKAERYYLGTYDTMEQAAAVRKLAELHRKNGDLDVWVKTLKAHH